MATFGVVRKRTVLIQPGIKFKFDYWMLLAVCGLVVLGLLLVYSSSFEYGPSYYFKRQLVATLIGFAGIAFVLQFDYHAFRKISVPFLVVTLLALGIVLFAGESIFGARRGLSGGSFQPSEVAKLMTILYVSHWLSSKGERIKQLTYGLGPFIVITGIVCAFIVSQPDLSTAILVALISFTLFFIAGADLKQFALALLLGGMLFLLVANTLPHAEKRMSEYKEALNDPALAGWQVQQSLVALGKGGLFGVGLGESSQKFSRLPFAHTDAVFAILGEELGLVGGLLLVSLYGILVWRGFKAARAARDSYGGLIALGVSCWIGFQALLNIAVITATIPFTGIPLPFVSYGGSSMAVTLVGVGFLLSISRDVAISKRPQPQVNRDVMQQRRSARMTEFSEEIGSSTP